MAARTRVRRKLARTSAAPGKTRLANFYRVQRGSEPALYLVDLPYFNASMAPVSKLSGQGSYRAAVGTFEMGVQRSIDQALAALEAKMAQYVR